MRRRAHGFGAHAPDITREEEGKSVQTVQSAPCRSRRGRGDRAGRRRATRNVARDGVSGRPRPVGPHRNTDQASRGHLRRERLVRPLLRDLPERDQHRRNAIHRGEGHPDGEQPGHLGHTHHQPQPLPAEAPHPGSGPHLRPEPQLCGGTAGRRRRQDGHVRPEDEHGHVHRALRSAGSRHGLLRRKHRHGPVELRTELLDERQLLGHDLRAVDPGCAEPRLGTDARWDGVRPEDRRRPSGVDRGELTERRRSRNGDR